MLYYNIYECKKEDSRRGTTIIDLIVAIVLTSIVVTIIFALWSNFDRHVVLQRRKSILHAEVRQILKSITSQVRRSPEVLAWHSTGITYVSPNNGDTIVYEYYTDELIKNDVLVTLISQAAYIYDFSIDEIDVSGSDEDPELTLLSISLSMADDFTNHVTVNSLVAVKVIGEQVEGEELTGWNF